MQWTPEQYRVLQPLIRKELEYLVYSILKNFDNVGCVLPPGIGGYHITATLFEEIKRDDVPLPETIEKEDVDIRADGATYCDMWLGFLGSSAEKK